MNALKWIVGVLATLLIGACTVNSHLATTGADEVSENNHFKNGRFYNEQAIAPSSLGKTFGILKRFLTEKKPDSEPSTELPVRPVSRDQLLQLSNSELHMVKLGHSSVLLKVYGEFWLLDPVFSERASPFSFLGPKRFHPTPIAIADLPPIDKILISHNHYDHLDKAAIQQLNQKTTQFLVPLGVAGDLIKWGVAADKVVSFDWWQELETSLGLVAFTPTRHFSGRALNDGNTSLWGSWVIKTGNENLFFSGDSGYFNGFKKIGRKYGPFDLTMIETGAYDKDWPDVHMTPEQSVQAHQDLQGRVMIPIHNGTFDLAFHAWYEPLERVTEIAGQQQVLLSTPVVGEVFSARQEPIAYRWWQSLIEPESYSQSDTERANEDNNKAVVSESLEGATASNYL